MNVSNPFTHWPDKKICDSADFDAANDYATRGAGLNGLADGMFGTFSAWVRLDGGDSGSMIMLSGSTTVGGTTTRFTALRSSGNKFQILCRDASNFTIFDISTVNTYTAGATWLHMLASWDVGIVTSNAQCRLRINDVSDRVVNNYNSGHVNIDYTLGDWAIGARPDGASKFNGCIAEMFFAPGYWLDISVESNRRKFISGDGKPVFLGDSGELPFGVAPAVYCKLNDGEAADNFITNRGSGGAFTLTGSLATGSSSPSD